MTAVVVTGKSAGTAGMTLAERFEPEPAINDVVIQVHASGFTSGELTWPSTWTDRVDRDRTPSIPGQELVGLVTDLGHDALEAVGMVDLVFDSPAATSRSGPQLGATGQRVRWTAPDGHRQSRDSRRRRRRAWPGRADQRADDHPRSSVNETRSSIRQ